MYGESADSGIVVGESTDSTDSDILIVKLAVAFHVYWIASLMFKLLRIF